MLCWLKKIAVYGLPLWFFAILIAIIEYYCEIIPSIRNLLSLHFLNPSFWQFITSGFVHANYSHFLNNVIAFLLFSVFGLIIAINCGSERDFVIVSVLLFIFIPIITSVYDVWYGPVMFHTQHLSNEVGCGSSGIVAATLGIIPIFWIRDISQKAKTELFNNYFFWLLLLLVICVVEVSYFNVIVYLMQTNPIILIINIGVVFAWIYLIKKYKDSFKIILQTLSSLNQTDYFSFILLFLTPFFFIGFSTVFFPSVMDLIGNRINIIAHYLGLGSGIIISAIYLYYLHDFLHRYQPNVAL